MTTTAVRLHAALAVVVLACGPALGQPPMAPPPHLTLDELVKEYRRLGLPIPPPDAELVRLTSDRDPPRLGFRCPPVKPGDRLRYLCGTEFEWHGRGDGVTVQPVKPTSDPLDGVIPTFSSDLLALAVQCRLRGWNELAAALNTRAGLAIIGTEVLVTEFNWGPMFGGPGRIVSVPGLRSKDFTNRSVAEELRLAASSYWLSRVMDANSDRREILRYLRVVDPGAEGLIRDLEITVAPRKSRPGSVEALIDALTDDRPGWGSGRAPLTESAYGKLMELGFDAVPALMQHLSDQRLSRHMGSRQYTSGFMSGIQLYHARVGHFVSWLLDDLSDGAIGGRALGERMADPEKVREWWEKARKVGEEKWLVEHALPAKDPAPHGFLGSGDELPGPNEVIFRALGAKYPARLAEVYETVLRKRQELDTDILAGVVAVSKLPRERKLALLAEGASHKQFVHRYAALEALAELDEAAFRKHLAATLKSFPRHVEGWVYTWSPEMRIVGLVRRTPDRECWEALAVATRRATIPMRMELLGQFQYEDEPERENLTRRERVRFLASFLGDHSTVQDEPRPNKPRDFLDDWDHHTGKVCDVAAEQLAFLYDLATWTNPERGPLSRLILRAVVARLAAAELARPGK